MQYKLLVNLILPEIEEEYEVYIPINKTVSDITSKIETPEEVEKKKKPKRRQLSPLRKTKMTAIQSIS